MAPASPGVAGRITASIPSRSRQASAKRFTLPTAVSRSGEGHRGVVERLQHCGAVPLEAEALARREEHVAAAVLLGDPHRAFARADRASGAVVNLHRLPSGEPQGGGSEFDVHITPSARPGAAAKGAD